MLFSAHFMPFHEWRARQRTQVSRARQSRDPVFRGHADYEVRLRHVVDGEYRWFHTSVAPLLTGGKIVK